VSDWESKAEPLADWTALEELIAARRRFVLTTHVNPDGDGLGSETALALYLRGIGKDVVVLNDGPTPHNFQFLKRSFSHEAFSEERAREVFENAEVLVILDTQARSRLGQLAPFVDWPGLTVVIIDHHLGEPAFGQVRVINPQACATGELVYDLVRRHPGALTLPMAEGLYAALVTDTGSFRFSNTDPQAHAMAAHLLALGVKPEPLLAQIHQHRHPDRLRFLGTVLSHLQLSADGSVSWLEADRELMSRFDVDGSDTEGLVDFPRGLPGVEAVVLFTEAENGRVKVSFRSTGRVDVDSVARSFGGGGHRAASGALVRGPLPEARERVLQAVEEAVARARNGGTVPSA
jgi:bifunctional oligoribonuclease and PAP phosphatase NrnA